MESVKMSWNSKQRRGRKPRKHGKIKCSFPKEKLENGDLYKFVLKKL